MLPAMFTYIISHWTPPRTHVHAEQSQRPAPLSNDVVYLTQMLQRHLFRCLDGVKTETWSPVAQVTGELLVKSTIQG